MILLNIKDFLKTKVVFGEKTLCKITHLQFGLYFSMRCDLIRQTKKEG